MLVSQLRMRAGARRLAAGTLLLQLAACSSGDLLLPEPVDDRTPVALVVVSGDGQAAPVNSAVPHPLVVRALDGAGRPAAGAVIIFQFVDPPNGATIAPPMSETDPDGRAAAEVVLGAPAGDQPVEARLDGSESEASVRFLLTAIRLNPGGGGDDDDDPPDDGGGSGGGGPPDDNGGDDGDDRGGDGDDGGGSDGGGGGEREERDDDRNGKGGSKGGDRDDDRDRDDDDDDEDDD